MTIKRKVTDELSSGSFQFQRNVDSSRFQCLEGTFENYKHILSETVNTQDDADRFSNQILDLMSRTRNTVDAYYPKSDDGGEVVAMGTEDTNACGLLEGPDEGRLYEYEPTLIPKKKLCVRGEKSVQQVAAGGLHSVSLHQDGTVSTWGANDEYALGRGEVEEDDLHLIKPILTSESGDVMKEIIQIGAGDNHTILLDIHGKVYVTGMYKDMDSGKWRDIGSRDAPIKGTHKFPIVVGGFGGKVSVIDAGNSWNAALSEDGFLYTWGMGNSGQLARSKSMGANKIKGKYIDSTGKNNEYEDLDLTKLYMGEIIVTKEKDRNGNDILLDDGKPKTYDAYNYFHKKIRNTFLNPQKVEWAGGNLGLKIEVLNFSCGDIHLLAVARAPGTFQSRVFSSGCSSFGQLGHGGTKNLHELTPIEALDDKNICKVAAGNSHSLALSIDGKNIYSWGKIDAGALGLYDEKKTLEYDATSFLGTPKQVAFPDTLGETPLVDISCGETTSFAITSTNSVYSWGYNENSQTGHYNDGETNLIPRPRLLDVISAVNIAIDKDNKKVVAKNCRVIRVAGGGQHSLMVIKRYL